MHAHNKHGYERLCGYMMNKNQEEFEFFNPFAI